MNERFNFNNLLHPYGEDSICYEYKSSDLFLNIFYNESKDVIKLVFRGCSYNYFAPVPGCYPELFHSKKGNLKSGCVYETLESEFLQQSEKVYEAASGRLKTEQRLFFLHLEWANVSFHIIAKDVEYINNQKLFNNG